MGSEMCIRDSQVFKQLSEKTIPIVFVKFEELRSNPRESLLDIFKLLLNKTTLEGTFAEKRIDDVLGLGHDATAVYKLKPTDGKFAAVERFTKEQ